MGRTGICEVYGNHLPKTSSHAVFQPPFLLQPNPFETFPTQKTPDSIFINLFGVTTFRVQNPVSSFIVPLSSRGLVVHNQVKPIQIFLSRFVSPHVPKVFAPPRRCHSRKPPELATLAYSPTMTADSAH